MRIDLNTATMSEQHQHLLSVISSDRFLKMQGIGNEVPFFICPYRPGEAIEFERMQRQLINKLSQAGITVLEINLYDLVLEILMTEGDWEWLIEEEKNISKNELKEELQSILDVETVLTPLIEKKMNHAEFQVMFLSGVGEVFPYIRSHNVLNNLQRTAKEKPTVMFFPGEYNQSRESGSSLELFGRLHDDRYYRAINIFLTEV